VVFRQPRSGFTRVPFAQTCRLRFGADEARAQVCNVSLLGLFLHLELPPPAGTECDLSLPLPDGGVPLVARGAVTWTQLEPPARASDLPIGCGLRFVSVDPADVRRLAALISLHAPESPLVGVTQPASGQLRIPFVTSCVLSTKDGIVRGTLCNLSARGAYAAVPEPPRRGESLLVSFRLPGQAELFERAALCAWENPPRATRVRALPPGCGLHFVDLSDADVALLEATVADYLAASVTPA